MPPTKGERPRPRPKNLGFLPVVNAIPLLMNAFFRWGGLAVAEHNPTGSVEELRSTPEVLGTPRPGWRPVAVTRRKRNDFWMAVPVLPYMARAQAAQNRSSRSISVRPNRTEHRSFRTLLTGSSFSTRSWSDKPSTPPQARSCGEFLGGGAWQRDTVGTEPQMLRRLLELLAVRDHSPILSCWTIEIVGHCNI